MNRNIATSTKKIITRYEGDGYNVSAWVRLQVFTRLHRIHIRTSPCALEQYPLGLSPSVVYEYKPTCDCPIDECQRKSYWQAAYKAQGVVLKGFLAPSRHQGRLSDSGQHTLQQQGHSSAPCAYEPLYPSRRIVRSSVNLTSLISARGRMGACALANMLRTSYR